MKKIITLLILSTSYIFSNINAIVSIAPEMNFVKAIGGDKVDVSLMVQAGNSPHTYEPKPSQMTAVAKADVYFAMGVEFEQVWLPKFKNLNAKMNVVDLSQGIEKMDMVHHEEHHAHTEHTHEGKDPHIWTSPANVKVIAQNIYKALSTIDPNNTKYYENNLNLFLSKIDNTDKQIKELLSTLKGSRKFMVFHPSWGYFAKAYHLEQIAVEVEGKSPKPRELVNLIKEAKEEQVNAIFTQPEFSDKSAKIIAHELHIPVVRISPMAPDWSENLINIAKTIAGKN
ncbi:Zinc ABC transporter, periplasmic-binding protein ZnuA [hydrothermal vent metagenome]|uniref:Zinc ABC transporter, periplasmic-binding protein ZnuA n=1 Tax=hydrothermal vent metagenome TaxID=652676 RepID=A0A1W1CE05_9ZZZZ